MHFSLAVVRVSRFTLLNWNVQNLMECTKCKLQYVGKAETELNLRINNHREDVLKLNEIPTDRHVAQRDHDFNTDTKFSSIEKLLNTKLSKESITKLLKKHENFWIKN